MSVTTGLTVVTVSSTLQSVPIAERTKLAKHLPNLVLLNSHANGGLQLGLDSDPGEVLNHLERIRKEFPDLVFYMEDVTDNDPFAYFEDWTIIPRVDKTGLYQLILHSKLANSRNVMKELENLVTSFSVVKVVKGEGEMMIQVGHVLEFIAYSDRLRKEPGVSLERRHTWHLQSRGKVDRGKMGAGGIDRLFWVKVNDPELDRLSAAQKQYNFHLRLRAIGKVKQLEQQFFGISHSFLVVFSGEEDVRVDQAGSDLSLMELAPDSLPDCYLPTYKVDDHGFYTVSGTFPQDSNDELKRKFAEEMKKIGAVGFTGNESVFRLHYVNSRLAETAFSLASLPQYRNFNLSMESLPVSRPERTDSKLIKMIPSVQELKESQSCSEKTEEEGIGGEKDGKDSQVLKPKKEVKEVSRKMKNNEEEKSTGKKPVRKPSAVTTCELTERELLTINWQQGRTLHTALKSLAKFLYSVNIAEVVEQEDSIIFRMTEKKKFLKSLKIYSRNETNSFDKLHSSVQRLAFFPSKANDNMFGLSVYKEVENEDLMKDLIVKYPNHKIEERSQVKILWLPSKLEYYKALTDKSLNVYLMPSIQNFSELKTSSEDGNKNLLEVLEEPSEIPKVSGLKDINENDRNQKIEDSLKMTEKVVFGFIWKNIADFKIKEEQVISRQLTEFIKTVQCSDITDSDDGLVFHFSSEEDFNAVITKYCPELLGDEQKLESLTRKFTLVPSRGLYGVFSTKRFKQRDFPGAEAGHLYPNSLWFSDKMEVIRLLRDEDISGLYPNLYIECRNIMILQSIRPRPPKTSIKLTPVNLDLICSRKFKSKHFGANVNYSRCDGTVWSSPHLSCPPSQSSSGGVYSHDLSPDSSKGLLGEAQLRNRKVEAAATDIRNILVGKEMELNTSMKDIKMKRVELFLKEGLGLDSSNSKEDVDHGLSQEVKEVAPEERLVEVSDVSEPDHKKVEDLGATGLGFHTLFIPYDEEKDTDLRDRLVKDIAWFQSPESVMSTVDTSGRSIFRVRMRNKEVAIASYLGLKLKYPGLEIDKTGEDQVVSGYLTFSF